MQVRPAAAAASAPAVTMRIVHVLLILMRSHCGSRTRLLCCEFGIPENCSEDDVRAGCSRTTCFKCARLTAEPVGPYICGVHEPATGPASPSHPLHAPPSLPPPRPSSTASPSAASIAPPPALAAVATPSSSQGSHSRNLNNCLVVITCQYPVVHSSVLPISHTLTQQTPLAP